MTRSTKTFVNARGVRRLGGEAEQQVRNLNGTG